jgi:hypothetical protein
MYLIHLIEDFISLFKDGSSSAFSADYEEKIEWNRGKVSKEGKEVRKKGMEREGGRRKGEEERKTERERREREEQSV